MSSEPMRTAVLDLGSNSFHLLVAQCGGHQLTPVLREREMLHLGRVVAEQGHIPDQQRDNAAAVVGHLAELARRTGASTVQAVATAALREAANGHEVIEALTAAAGVPVQILSGAEEAHRTYVGVRASVAVAREPVLVLDLGGGSLELAVGHGGDMLLAESVPLGVSRLSALVNTDPLSSSDVERLVDRIDEELEPLRAVVGAFDAAKVVGVGGTMRSLARIIAAREDVWLPSTLNQLRFDHATLRSLTDELVAGDRDARARVRGMKDRRADHANIGALVIDRTLTLLGIDAVTVSDWGLREGVLLVSAGVDAPLTAGELRASEVRRVRRTFIPDDRHATHVATLATELFSGSRTLHGLDDRAGELLGHAACLHAIGKAVALRRQHLHGAYLLQHAELRGFEPAEIAMLATLIRFHPSRGIDASYEPFASLSRRDRDRTEQLLALLHVADALDRAYDQSVKNVEVVLADGQMILTIFGDGHHLVEDELTRRARLLSRTFDVEVIFRGIQDATGRSALPY